MRAERPPVSSHRIGRLAAKMSDAGYRNRYMESHTRQILAKQMREFRGELSQAEFARKIGKSQQIVSRLENPSYHGWTVATVFEVASKLGVAAFVRFVDFPTFLKYTSDMSEAALRPSEYQQEAVDELAEQEAFPEGGGAWRDFFDGAGREQQPTGKSAVEASDRPVQPDDIKNSAMSAVA